MAGLGIDWSKYATMQPVAPAAPTKTVGWSQRMTGQPQGAQPGAPAKTGLGIDWSKYTTMQPAAPEATTAQPEATSQSPRGWLARFGQHALQMATGASNLQDVENGFTQGLPYIFEHPIESAKLVGGAALQGQKQQMSRGWSQLLGAAKDSNATAGDRLALASQGVGHMLAGAVPIYGPMAAQTGEDAGDRKWAEAAGDVAGGVGAEMAPKVLEPVARGWSRRITAPMAARMASTGGEAFTRAEMVARAKQFGIPLTPAEATGNPTLAGIQAIGERGLFGGEAAAKQRLAVDAGLRRWSNDLMNRISPKNLTPDQAGRAIQQQLRDALTRLHQDASQEFRAIHGEAGGATVDATPIRETAQDILDEFGQQYKKFPRQLQGAKEAWGWVNDLAKLGAEKAAKAPDIWEREFGGGESPSKPVQMTFDEAQKLRSHLLELERNNPDLIKPTTGGWYQRLTGAIDNAMMDSAKNLDPALEARFREANAKWEELKNDFDSPQGLFYQAIRSEKPIEVPGMFLQRTRGGSVELINKLMSHLSDPDLFRREFAERLVDPQATGQPTLHLVGSRMKPYSAEVIDKILGPEAANDFRMLAKTARETHYNANPSMTSNVLSKMQDAEAILGAVSAAAQGQGSLAATLAAVPGMKAALARFSFSPAVSEWLSRGGPMRGNLAPRMQFLNELRAARQALATEGMEAQSNNQ